MRVAGSAELPGCRHCSIGSAESPEILTAAQPGNRSNPVTLQPSNAHGPPQTDRPVPQAAPDSGAVCGRAAGAARHAGALPVPRRHPATSTRCPIDQILLAAALTLLGYLVMTGYDTLAFRYIRHPLPYFKIALASFIGYAFNNNVGFSGLVGGSLRYRLYNAWRLTAVEIAKVIAFCTISFWLGFVLLGGDLFSDDAARRSRRRFTCRSRRSGCSASSCCCRPSATCSGSRSAASRCASSSGSSSFPRRDSSSRRWRRRASTGSSPRRCSTSCCPTRCR